MQRGILALPIAAVLCLGGTCGKTSYDPRPEVEPNDGPTTATLISGNTGAYRNEGPVLAGTLTPGDVDWWSIALPEDSVLTLSLYEEGHGELHDARLGVFAGDGTLLAVNDDGGPGFLSRIAVPIGNTGMFRVAVAGFGDDDFDGTGSEQAFEYRLVVGVASPQGVLNEQETAGENDDPATPEPLMAGRMIPAQPRAVVVNGTLSTLDVDYYSVPIFAGETATVSVFDDEGGTVHDTELQVLDPNGAVIASDDDGGPGFLSNLSFVSPAASSPLRVGLRSFLGQQGPVDQSFRYRLVVSVE